jgi:hypothetical protein
MPCRSIGLLLEGDGDYEAVPLLVRKIAQYRNYNDLIIGTKPIKIGDVPCMLKGDKFLRLFEYAFLRDDVDGLIIALDCEDRCALEVIRELYERVALIVERCEKPIGIVLFVKEYETMFLMNIEHIAERCKSIALNPQAVIGTGNIMARRDAKGSLSLAIVGGSYKPTRDQARLTAAMDIRQCSATYRPLAHFVNLIDWIYNWDGRKQFY